MIYDKIIEDIPSVQHIEIAETLNKYFSNVGPSLSDQLPQTEIKIDHYTRPVSSEFQFESITLNDVEKEIRNLVESKSSGIDKISRKCLKNSCCVLQQF